MLVATTLVPRGGSCFCPKSHPPRIFRASVQSPQFVAEFSGRSRQEKRARTLLSCPTPTCSPLVMLAISACSFLARVSPPIPNRRGRPRSPGSGGRRIPWRVRSRAPLSVCRSAATSPSVAARSPSATATSAESPTAKQVDRRFRDGDDVLLCTDAGPGELNLPLLRRPGQLRHAVEPDARRPAHRDACRLWSPCNPHSCAEVPSEQRLANSLRPFAAASRRLFPQFSRYQRPFPIASSRRIVALDGMELGRLR